MTRHVLLLQGINLASRRRVAMAQLRELLEAAGFDDVVTHGQSGNVVVGSGKRPATVRREAEKAIGAGVGFDVDVVVRTAAELAAVVEADPFGALVDEPKRYQVVFLTEEPDPEAVAALEQAAADLEPERVAVRGREVYCWHANGIQRSPLSKRLDVAGLPGVATARNWNTVLKLRELSAGG